ncbi:MAG: trigger factor [Bacteroidales bacterium]|nr:trigger factor [Bacteroidales bacterium]
MNITHEESGELTAIVKIDIEKNDYQQKVNEKLGEYRRKAKMPGFREGKVPMGIIRRMYGNAILVEEINTLISQSLESYITDNNIKTIASPLPNKEKQETIDFDTQETFSFYFDIALEPELTIDPVTIKGIKRYSITPSKAVIDDYIHDIQKQHGTIEETETITEDSIVQCTIREMSDDGSVKEEGIANEAPVYVRYIKDDKTKKAFLSAKKADTLVIDPKKAFDNVSEVTSLLGIDKEQYETLSSKFNFTIESIKTIIPAKPDKTLFKKAFPNIEIADEKEMREHVKTDIEKSFAAATENKLIDDITKVIQEESKITLPHEFMKRWIMESDEEKKLSLEDIEKNYNDYASLLISRIIRNKLTEKYNLAVNEDDINRHIANILGMEEALDSEDQEKKAGLLSIVNTVKQNKQQFEQVVDHLVDKKLLSFFTENIKIPEKKVSKEEFDKLVSK